MNSRYLACPTCRLYVDAGYRWAYWLLEHPGVVHLGEGVDVDAVLAREDYWNPSEEERSEWLCGEVLPRVRRFLTEHGGHGVVYIEEEHLSAEESLAANWMEVSRSLDRS